MILSRNAPSRAWSKAVASVRGDCDNVYKLHVSQHASCFTTTAARNNSGPEPIRSSRKSSAKERQRAERDQLIKSLKESPGKRDAKNFLKHFDTPKKAEPAPSARVDRHTSDAVRQAHHNEWRLTRTGVNLGNLYEPTKAIQESPVFALQPLKDHRAPENVEPLHIALVKLRQPQALDDKTLGGIALTLSQMVRLGLNIALVVDCDEDVTPENMELNPAWEEKVREQATRIVDALEDFNEPGAFEVDHALYYSELDSGIHRNVHVRGCVQVMNNQLLFPPIEDGIIPVIPPIAYDSECKKVRVQPDEVVLALTREFTGITSQQTPKDELHESDDALHKEESASADKPLLDRIIILDPVGGIPDESRADGVHVFINLEAEYADVRKELQRLSARLTSNYGSERHSKLADSNPFSKFGESNLAPLPGPENELLTSESAPDRHTRNLDVVQKSLKLLPPSSSALIITPTEAAVSSQAALLPTHSTGVRTRRSKNPLIHNLLTDKPTISSSLPAPLVSRPTSTEPNPATFLKKGIPVTIIPDPRISPWQPPSLTNKSIDLQSDPRIDLAKLVDLIEDSFRRKLDARHYLERIRGRVAGIIIAGNYEGGAICTWETPPFLVTASSPSISGHSALAQPTYPPPDSHLWVPYLDKFAVLTSSQGSGGVADIVWGALTRACFPDGFVWRSRSSNPVNKWYFERSVGMWNLPGDQWTMFWTTDGVVEEWAKRQEEVREREMRGVEGNKVNAMVKGDLTRWEAYVAVCSSVEPSWADGRKPD